MTHEACPICWLVDEWGAAMATVEHHELATERGIKRVPVGTWIVDLVHSSISFRIRHMGSAPFAAALPTSRDGSSPRPTITTVARREPRAVCAWIVHERAAITPHGG